MALGVTYKQKTEAVSESKQKISYTFYLVTEAPDITLQSFIDSQELKQYKDIYYLVKQLLSMVKYLHKKSIVHG